MCFLDWVGLSSIFATVDSELPEECVLKKGITTMEDYCWSVLQLVALVTLVCAVPVCGELTSEGVNYEVQALMAIKLELIDPQGCLSGWDSSSVDPCSWFHVTCSNNQSVIELNIASRGLSGLLSSNVGNLTNLLYLSLQNNNISGSIPAELGKLSKLSSLDLSNNLFSGKIPQALGQIQGLTYLRLNNNNLSGVIPMSLSAVHVLDYVDLSNNNLSGHVPHLSAKTLIVAGNPLLCGSTANQECRGDSPLQMPLPLASKDTNHAKSRKLIIAIGPAISIVLFGFVVFAFILWRRHHNQPIFYDVSEQQDPEVCLGQLKKFGFRELQIATDHFHPRNIIGSGGFGDVYKGHLTDGSVVAVKRFMKNRINAGGEMQFQTEIEMISVAVHRNLLRLIGYCVTPTERILVYPYMCNGSVASCLKKKPALDWPNRKRIALGTARGLLYLHEQCDPKIIHRDVKAANILLDEDYEAVVGDFGLAKLLNHNESHATTAVRGTLGHIAPEYLSTGKTSEKTDVFGFGILLLELITGQRASNLGHLSNLPNQKGYAILNWVKKLQQEKRLCEMLDSELNGDCNEAELEELVQVALLCTQFSPLDRPKMSEVMCMLVGDGLVERWDAWQKAEAEHSGSEPWSQRYFDLVENSLLIEEMDGASFTLEALELSAPR